jgi:hypothetical protein
VASGWAGAGLTTSGVAEDNPTVGVTSFDGASQAKLRTTNSSNVLQAVFTNQRYEPRPSGVSEKALLLQAKGSGTA